MGVNEGCLANPSRYPVDPKRRQAAALQEECCLEKRFSEKFQAVVKGCFVAREQVTSKKGWNFVELNGITWNFAERKTGVKAKIRSK